MDVYAEAITPHYYYFFKKIPVGRTCDFDTSKSKIHKQFRRGLLRGHRFLRRIMKSLVNY